MCDIISATCLWVMLLADSYAWDSFIRFRTMDTTTVRGVLCNRYSICLMFFSLIHFSFDCVCFFNTNWTKRNAWG
jgi:hypothetical protein